MIRKAAFKPAWWLPGPHAQTLWAALCRRPPRPPVRRERLELPDGDFLDLDWAGPVGRPLVMILHGLEGSSDSAYARGLLWAVMAHGWCGVVLHFRGCSGEPNRRAASYNAGHTADLDHVIRDWRRREPATPLACVGYSLGGNVLLKWLGEQGEAAPVQAAVAVSVPFLLSGAAERLQQGFSRLYQAYLLHHLRASYRAKASLAAQLPLSLAEMGCLRDFYRFDDRVTAPLHGYRGVHDYYQHASCRPYLRAIRVPTLLIQALDDPFLLPTVVPAADELAAGTVLELSRYGGHVGFVSGRLPGQAVYWLEQRIPGFLQHHLAGVCAAGTGW